jgi:hypothetical protein
MYGNSFNIVSVGREVVKGTKNVKDDRGKTARAKEAGDLKEGEYVAAHVKTESEPWVLGKVIKSIWCQADCGHNLRGKRGEKLEPGENYFTVRKLDSGYGSSELHYGHAEVEGDEGPLAVPACNLIASGVVLVVPSMHHLAKEVALGTEYGDVSRTETTKVMACLHAHLPMRESARIWGRCPQ